MSDYHDRDDLVGTLRRFHALKGWPHLRDAADEIERLRAENAKLRHMGDGSYRP